MIHEITPLRYSLETETNRTMNEFEYIAWLRQQTKLSPGVLVGPGDDCAVLVGTGATPTLVTTDMLLEGSHFRLSETTPFRIGRKAMAVNVSDIAAMGGTPTFAFMSVGLPRGGAGEIATELYRGMRDIADRFGVVSAGGDTTSWTGGLVVSVTLLGTPGPQGPILRSGARAGDWLFVTGPLGGSIRGKHFDFIPRVVEARQLQDHANIHAMIDLSDGLAGDVGHICVESGCGVELYSEQIPITEAAQATNDGRTPTEHALSDGEDFELAFAVSREDGQKLLASQPIPGVKLTAVGLFLREPGMWLVEGGARRQIAPRGFIHAFE